ncbi:MAG: hypothetical protein HOP27_16840 [Anaerolineales bacterium]|nr:hypothetical protein [Anaerolineales bacterium]
MIKQKFLNLVLSILVVASLLFGGINQASAQEPNPTVPQGSGQAQDPAVPADVTLTDRVTPAERQAVADRNTALGLLPGLAKPLPVVKNNRRAAAPDPSVVPHYFGPFANYANSPLPKGTIAELVVEDGGTGYLVGDVVNIYDAYGTGMDAIAEVATVDGNGTILTTTITNAGFDYSAPIIVVDETNGTGAVVTPVLGSLSGGIRKFVDSLPGLTPAGKNNLNNYIPVATADTTTFNAGGPYAADYYEIALVEFTQQLHSDLPPTTLRGYVQLETPALAAKLLLADPTYVHVPLFYPDGITPILFANGDPVYAVDKPRYLGPTIVALSERPVRITFYNFLPTTAEGGDLFIPVDESVMGAGEGPLNAAGGDCYRDTQDCEKYSQNRATLHLHGGLVPWISDGTPHQWTTPAGENTKYPTGVSTEYVPDMWFDNTTGDIISNTTGQTNPLSFPGASNNPSGTVNGAGAMTFYYNNQQSARLQFYHDHAYGITRLNVYAGEAAGYVITDAVEQDLINGTNNTLVNPGLFKIPGDGNPASGSVGIPLIFQDKTFVDATTIAAQDPTWRWGTGELVGGRRVPNTGDLWLPSVYMPIQNPWDQVAGANAFGRWQYGPWFWPPTESVVNGPRANEYYDPGCDPALTWCEPPMRNDSPTPSMGMEAYMDTSLVNGAVYPFVTLEPKAYRFRLLNAANDRFYNLSMFVAVDANGVACDETNLTPAPESTGETCTEVRMVAATNDPAVNPNYPATWPADSRAGGAPDPALSGPNWIQIGTEGGFLPAPVEIAPQPVTWQGNPGLFNVGNVLDHSLLLGNAERADVIVDFSQYAGHTIIVYNDAPTAFPALDPRYDYYTGNPSQMDSGGAPTTQAGYGPNTRTVMQIRVAGAVTPGLEVPFNLNALNAVFAHGPAEKPGVFETSQEPIIVPQAAYDSAYGATFPADSSQYAKITDRGLTFTPFGSSTPKTVTFQEKAIHDEMGATWDNEYGRMSGNLGLELPGTNNLNQNIILYGYASPPVDFLVDSPIVPLGTLPDGTTLWKITHNGVDTHPIHIHLANAQLINRVGWDGLLIPPDANELGWKETIRINPLESTIWAIRPELPVQPFDVPNSKRVIDPTYPENFSLMGPPGGFIDPNLIQVVVANKVINYGWEYVWHCHILSHEEMDMMHSLVFAVTPDAPTGLTATVANATTINLAWTDNSVNETGFIIQRSANGVDWTNVKTEPSSGPSKGPVATTDTVADTNVMYLYKVLATNLVGDPTVYPLGAGFPTVTKNSLPSNTAASKIGVTSIVRALANPTSAASVAFTVTFSEAVSGVDAGDFETAITGLGGTPSVTDVTGSGASYTVTVSTGTGSGTLGLNLLNNGSIITVAGLLPISAGFTGEVYIVEKVGPSVLSVVIPAAATNPTNKTGVTFTVTFDKAVTGVDVTDFVISGTLPTSSVKSVTGSGATYTVTANTGVGTGTLGLNVAANGTILDATATPLTSGFTGAEFYTVDTVPPTVVSSVLASANPTIAASVNFTVTFSESVSGVDKTDFTLGPTITGASVATVTPVSGTVYTVAVNTGTGAGPLRLNVADNNSIKDATYNSLGGPGNTPYSSGESYTINRWPIVNSIVPASTNPTAAASVSFTVTFSKPVYGVDLADFSLVQSGGVSGATLTSISGTGATRTVVANTGSGDGSLQLDLVDNNTIVDTTLYPLGGPGSANGNFAGQPYTVQKLRVLSINRASADNTAASSVSYTVTFSKPVYGVDLSDFSLAPSGVTGAALTSITGSGATRTVTVNTGTGSGTLGLNLVDNDTIVDTTSNPLGGVGAGNGNFTGQVYTVDRLRVLSINRVNGSPTAATSVSYTVTFSKPVYGVDLADFNLTLSGVTGASLTSISGTSATRTVVVNTGTGGGTLQLDLTDNNTIVDYTSNPLGGAGVGNGNFSGQPYTVDKPSVLSINRASADNTAASIVNYTVTFSEPVYGVDLADFSLVQSGGVSGATLRSISGTGAVRTVSVNTGTGSGSLQLNLVDNNTIVDYSSYPLGGVGAGNGDFTGQVYTINRLSVLTIARVDLNPTAAASVSYTVTFSSPVYGVDLTDFTLALSGVTDASITSISGTGAVRTVVVNTGTGNGTLQLNLVDDNTIVDYSSNPLGGTGAGNGNFSGEIYDVVR